MAVAGARVDGRFLGLLLVRFFAGVPRGDVVALRGALLARFFAGALDARFFAGALLARFFAGVPRGDVVALRGAVLARFFADALDARFFVVFFVAMASPEASTLSESLRVATSSATSALDQVHELDLLGSGWRLAGRGNHADLLIAHRFEHAQHEGVARRDPSEQVLERRANSVADSVGR